MFRLPDVKCITAAVILGLWFVLVLTGKAPAGEFIDLLRNVLLGLGVYHTVSNLQPVPRDPPANTPNNGKGKS